MSEWRDFLCAEERSQLHRIESRMDADKADRRRLVNRAFARMARDKVRRDGIRRINAAMSGDAGKTPSIKIDGFKFNASDPIHGDADQ